MYMPCHPLNEEGRRCRSVKQAQAMAYPFIARQYVLLGTFQAFQLLSTSQTHLGLAE